MRHAVETGLLLSLLAVTDSKPSLPVLISILHSRARWTAFLYIVLLPSLISDRLGFPGTALPTISYLREFYGDAILVAAGESGWLYAAVADCAQELAGSSFNRIERSLIAQAIAGYAVAAGGWPQLFNSALILGLPLCFMPAISQLRANVKIVKTKPQRRPIDAERRKLWIAIRVYVLFSVSAVLFVRTFVHLELGTEPISFLLKRLSFGILGYWFIITASGILCCVYLFSKPLDGISKFPHSAMRLLQQQSPPPTPLASSSGDEAAGKATFFFDEENTSSRRARALDRRRKFFHVLVVLIFLPTLNRDLDTSRFALGVAMSLFLIEETIRATALPPLGVPIHKFLSGFTDERDRNGIVVSHLFLLAGVAAPCWLSGVALGTQPHFANLSGILTLGAGDAAASVIGKKFGRLHWPETRKTVEGTLAFLGAVVALSYIAMYFDWSNSLPWSKLLVATTLTALLEAFGSQNDNLVAPIYMWLLLVA
ncbi:dolichol kinase [Savitreella phatthalungensis]